MDRITQLRDFLKASPGDNFLTHALALEYIKIGDDQTAHSLFEFNLEAHPMYIPTFYHLGKLLERIGKTQQAIEMYSRGMTVAHESGDSHAYSELRSVFEELTF